MSQEQDRAISELIDEICDEFEDAWRKRTPLSIENCLKRVPEEHANELFRELLELELELEQSPVEHPDVTGPLPIVESQRRYHERFPQYGEVIDSLFQRIEKQKTIGDYEILQELGHGGMGVVYKARQKHLDQIVALKVLPQSLLDDPQAVARFRREMQLTGKLNHPNIVRALNAGESDGAHFLVMEFVEGINLQQLVDRLTKAGEHIPLPVVCEIVRQTAIGLQHAHEDGLVHRDIKPANLMLDQSGTIKILDLGLGKFLSEQHSEDSSMLTRLGATMGTIDYISPEQCENAGEADIRSDIYSLGCTFYFLAIGRAPYSGTRFDSTRKKLMAHIVGEVPSLMASVSEATVELEKIFNKMLAKEPQNRFQTPIELAEAMEPFADEQMLHDQLDLWHDQFGDTLTGRPVSRTRGRITSKKPLPKRFPWRKASWKKKIALSVPLIVVLVVLFFMLHAKREDLHDESAMLVETRLSVVQMPGLNGRWWFEEIPWFIPPVREAILKKLVTVSDPQLVLGEVPKKYFDPNAADVYQWLWELTETCLAEEELTVSQKELIKTLKSLCDLGQDDGELAKSLERAIETFLTDVQSQKNQSAVDRHTLGNLYHRLALLKEEKTNALYAVKAYQEALELYAVKAEKTSSPLESFLLSDMARVKVRSENHVAAMTDFEALREREKHGETMAPLFLAEMLAVYGALCAEAGRYQDNLFDEAQAALDRCVVGKLSHPLGAHIAERHAWSCIDQWKVNDALQLFKDALLYRETNHKVAKNPYALIYIYHNMHGLAMTHRYQGDPALAIREYQETLRQIDAERNHVQNINSSFDRLHAANLRERAANTRERMADCTFYGGAASEQMRGQWREAARLYQEAGELYEPIGMKLVMQTKQAIMLFLIGDSERESGQAILEQVRAKQNDPEIKLPGNEIRLRLLLELAEALAENPLPENISPTETETVLPVAGREKLRGLLRNFDQLTGSEAESNRRENMEIRLFCAEHQLNSSLQNGNLAEANLDFLFLRKSLVTLWRNPEMYPFIRRYLDMAIRLSVMSYQKDKGQNHLEQIVTEILVPLRIGKDKQLAAQINQATVLLVFHITDNPEEGFVIFSPRKDGRPARFYPLPWTRTEVRQESQSFELDVELVQLVRTELSSGGKVVCSWNDEACWPTRTESFNEDNFPFDDLFQIP